MNTKLAGKSDTSHSHAWSAITGKPSIFPPSTHNHDDRYYTESEMNAKLAGKSDTSHSHRYYEVHSLFTEQKTITLSANAYQIVYLNFDAANVQAIGICGIDTNNVCLLVTRYMLYASAGTGYTDQVKMEVRNITSGQQTVTVRAMVLVREATDI